MLAPRPRPVRTLVYDNPFASPRTHPPSSHTPHTGSRIPYEIISLRRSSPATSSRRPEDTPVRHIHTRTHTHIIQRTRAPTNARNSTPRTLLNLGCTHAYADTHSHTSSPDSYKRTNERTSERADDAISGNGNNTSFNSTRPTLDAGGCARPCTSLELLQILTSILGRGGREGVVCCSRSLPAVAAEGEGEEGAEEGKEEAEEQEEEEERTGGAEKKKGTDRPTIHNNNQLQLQQPPPPR